MQQYIAAPSTKFSAHGMLPRLAEVCIMKKRTVLIVDNDPATRTLLAKLLSNNGCLVQSAESADVAMDIVFNDPPEAVLLNPDLPGVDLDTFKEALQKQNP